MLVVVLGLVSVPAVMPRRDSASNPAGPAIRLTVLPGIDRDLQVFAACCKSTAALPMLPSWALILVASESQVSPGSMVMVAVRGAGALDLDLETVAGAQGRLACEVHRLVEADGAARQAQRIQHAGAVGIDGHAAPVDWPSAPPILLRPLHAAIGVDARRRRHW